MNTISGCPYHPAPAAAPKRSALADKLNDDRADTIPCPVLRTLVNEGYLSVDQNGMVSIWQLRSALKKIGVGFLPRQALALAAKTAEATGFLSGLAASEFNIYHLAGGSLDHTGDTQILRGGYQQARMDRLKGYSSDGVTITLSDMARAQKDQVRDEPGEKGHRVGGFELTALLTLFGHENADGELYLTLDELVTLYRDNKFPADWDRRGVGIWKLGAEAREFFAHQA